MPQQDITVQYLGLNKKNPKYAYIKSAEGDSYGCNPEQLKQFSTGEVCNISYQINQKGFKDFLAKNNTKGAPQGISKTNARPRMDPADARGAFITVILEAFVKAGKVPLDATAIGRARQEIGAGYDQSHNPQQRDDMNDEIPY